MASEFVTHLIDVHDKAEHDALREFSTYAEKAAKVLTIVDAELSEVREVLDGLIRNRLSTGPCWCRSRVNEHDEWRTPGEHDKRCDQTRSIYEKLRIDK
jgi:hypothetical protein